ncbi:hypothetical protein P9112_006482 [Eukaryota sp. TZLM1-RC]
MPISRPMSINETSIIDINLHRGKQCLIRSSLEEAITFFSQVLNEDPHNTTALFYRSLSYLQLHDCLPLAEQDFKTLFSLKVKLDPMVYFLSAVCFKKQSKHIHAIRRMSAFLRISPRHSDALLIRAELYLTIGDITKALADFMLALSNSIDISSALSGIGYCHLLQEAPKEAFKYSLRAIDLCGQLPYSELISFRHGLVCLKLGKYEDSECYFNHSLVTNKNRTGLNLPSFTEPLYYSALVKTLLDRPSEALKDLDELDLVTISSKAIRLRARIYFELQMFDQALPSFRKFAELQDDSEARSFVLLLDVIVNLKKQKSGNSIFKKALQQTTKSMLCFDHFLINLVRGYAHAKQGDVDAGLVEYKKAVVEIENMSCTTTTVPSQSVYLAKVNQMIRYNCQVLSAFSLMKKLQFKKALTIIDCELENNVSRGELVVDLYFMKSFCYYYLGNIKKSLIYAKKASKHGCSSINSPQINLNPGYFLALILANTDKFMESVDVLSTIIDEYSNNPSKLIGFLRLLRSLCFTMESLRIDDKSLAEKARIDAEIVKSSSLLQDDSTLCNQILSKVFFALGNHAKCIELSGSCSSNFELACIYWSIGDLNNALKLLESSNDLQNSILLAKFLISLKKFKECESLLSNLGKSQRKVLVDYKCFKLLVDIYYEKGNVSRFLIVLDDLIDQSIDGLIFNQSWMFNLKGLILFIQNRENCEEFFEKSLIHNPSPSILFNCAVFYLSINEFPKALDCLSRVNQRVLSSSSLLSVSELKDSPNAFYRLHIAKFVVEAAVCGRFTSENDISLNYGCFGEDEPPNLTDDLTDDEVVDKFLNETPEDEKSQKKVQSNSLTTEDLQFIENNSVYLDGNVPIKINSLSKIIETKIGIRNFIFKTIVPLPDLAPLKIVDLEKYFPVSSFKLEDYILTLIPPWIE